MKKIIHDMIEKGLLNQLHQKWKSPKQDCKPLIRKRKAISIEKLATVFSILLFGIVVASIISFLEIFSVHKFSYDTSKIQTLDQYRKDVQNIENLISELDDTLLKKDVQKLLLIIHKLYMKKYSVKE